MLNSLNYYSVLKEQMFCGLFVKSEDVTEYETSFLLLHTNLLIYLVLCKPVWNSQCPQNSKDKPRKRKNKTNMQNITKYMVKARKYFTLRGFYYFGYEPTNPSQRSNIKLHYYRSAQKLYWSKPRTIRRSTKYIMEKRRIKREEQKWQFRRD